MNYTILAVETVVMVVAFTGMIMIPLLKDPVWWIHDYPENIQEKYFETHERIPSKMTDRTVILKKGFALLLALIFMVVLAVLAGADSFLTGFLSTYFIWFVINWYDCFFLDWVLFANIKKIRLPGTEHMDKEYHQKKYHFVRGLIGMVLGLLPCLATGVIVMLIA